MDSNRVTETFDADLVKYVADVAASLQQYRKRALSYGDFYIERVVFGFDGETVTNIAVSATEFDTLGVEVSR